jgi:hypothetical protein
MAATLARYIVMVQDRELWRQFKLHCQDHNITINDKFIEMIQDTVDGKTERTPIRDRVRSHVKGE